MKIFDDSLLNEAAQHNGVKNIATATIGEILLIAQYLEKKTGIPFIRMDQGSPGLPPNVYGIQAEKEALDIPGFAAAYPAASGIPEIKKAASRFVKAFIDVDITPESCVPTTGSVSASFGAFAACTTRIPGKNKVLFIDARNLGTMVTRKLRELSEEDILKIAGTYDKYVEGTLKDEKGYCATVGIEEIAKQEYILTPGRYVGIAETQDDGEPFEEKMTRLTTELGELFQKSHELEAEIKKQLASIGFEIK